MEQNAIERPIVPEMPRVVDVSQILVYAPVAGYASAGIASYDGTSFRIDENGKVTLRKNPLRTVIDVRIDIDAGQVAIHYDDGVITNLPLPLADKMHIVRTNGVTTIDFDDPSYWTQDGSEWVLTLTNSLTGYTSNNYIAVLEHKETNNAYSTLAHSIYKAADGSIVISATEPFEGRILIVGNSYREGLNMRNGSGENSIVQADDIGNTATADHSATFGRGNTNDARFSIVGGRSTTVDNTSHSILASGLSCTAVNSPRGILTGYLVNITDSGQGVTVGANNTIVGSGNALIGGSNNIVTTATDSIIAGNLGTVSAGRTYYNGVYGVVTGYCSFLHAEGATNAVSEVSGEAAWGGGRSPIVLADHSIGVGSFVKVEQNAKAAAAFGLYTIATSESQFVAGKCNLAVANSIVEIGNGTSTTNRSNAFVVYRDGRVASGKGATNANDLTQLSDLTTAISNAIGKPVVNIGTGAITSSPQFINIGHSNTASVVPYGGVNIGVINSASTSRYIVNIGYANTSEYQDTTLLGRMNTATSNGQTLIGYNVNTSNNPRFALGYNNVNWFEVLQDKRVKVFGAPTDDNDVVRLGDIKATVSTIYALKGSITAAELKEIDLATETLGSVYNLSEDYVTTTKPKFLEGRGVFIKKGTDIVVVEQGGVRYFNAYATTTNMSSYYNKSETDALLSRKIGNSISSTDILGDDQIFNTAYIESSFIRFERSSYDLSAMVSTDYQAGSIRNNQVELKLPTAGTEFAVVDPTVSTDAIQYIYGYANNKMIRVAAQIEQWTFTLEDGSTVTKNVVVK